VSNGRVGRDVYWRRRLLVLAALIGLVWGVLQVIDLVRGDDASTAAEPTAQPTSAATSAPTTPPTTAPPADQVPVAIETAATVCEPENVRIVPSVAAGQEAGAPVRIDLMVTALDGKACTFRPKADEMLAVVDTDRAPIYDSSVCRAAFFDQAIAIPEGWGTVTTIEWNGRGSGTACGPSEGFAPAGTYTLKIGTYGGEPGETTFKLAQRAPETPAPTTPAASPSASASAKPSGKPVATPSASASPKPAPKKPKPSATAE